MDPIIDNLDPEVQPIARRTTVMHGHNERMVQELHQMNVNLDLDGAHIDFLFSSLVDAGVITSMQYWEMTLKWETYLRNMLKNVRTDVNNRIAEMQRAEQTRQKLWRPGDPGGPNGSPRSAN